MLGTSTEAETPARWGCFGVGLRLGNTVGWGKAKVLGLEWESCAHHFLLKDHLSHPADVRVFSYRETVGVPWSASRTSAGIWQESPAGAQAVARETNLGYTPK